MKTTTMVLGLLALGLTTAACADAVPSTDTGTSGVDFGTDDDGTIDDGETEGASGDGDDGMEPKLDIGGGGSPVDEEECAELSEQAESIPVPADIIVVVDNSGSMGFEAGEVQARLNDFSAQVIDSGIDARVVLISSYPEEGNGICIDAPLGSGDCPQADSAAPRFTHVDQKVGSHDAWEQLLETHDEWAEALRPDSVKHVVVVTDDTSDLKLEEFKDGLVQLGLGMEQLVHHSVVCHSDCESAAGIGESYITLSNETGGVAADLCGQDFQAVFDALTTEVIGGSQLSCEFLLPPPTEGSEFDPDEVNLEFDDGMGGVQPIGRVDSAQACAGVADGWYYDDPQAPTMLVMCPQTCESFQDAASASVLIEFGCATVPAG